MIAPVTTAVNNIADFYSRELHKVGGNIVNNVKTGVRATLSVLSSRVWKGAERNAKLINSTLSITEKYLIAHGRGMTVIPYFAGIYMGTNGIKNFVDGACHIVERYATWEDREKQLRSTVDKVSFGFLTIGSLMGTLHFIKNDVGLENLLPIKAVQMLSHTGSTIYNFAAPLQLFGVSGEGVMSYVGNIGFKNIKDGCTAISFTIQVGTIIHNRLTRGKWADKEVWYKTQDLWRIAESSGKVCLIVLSRSLMVVPVLQLLPIDTIATVCLRHIRFDYIVETVNIISWIRFHAYEAQKKEPETVGGQSPGDEIKVNTAMDRGSIFPSGEDSSNPNTPVVPRKQPTSQPQYK